MSAPSTPIGIKAAAVQGFSSDRTTGAETRGIIASLPEELQAKVTSELASAPTQVTVDADKSVEHQAIALQQDQQTASSSTAPPAQASSNATNISNGTAPTFAQIPTSQESEITKLQTSQDKSRENQLEQKVQEARQKHLSAADARLKENEEKMRRAAEAQLDAEQAYRESAAMYLFYFLKFR